MTGGMVAMTDASVTAWTGHDRRKGTDRRITVEEPALRSPAGGDGPSKPAGGKRMKAGSLTVSDRSSRGEREDASGPALRDWLAERGVKAVRTEVVPDEEDRIAAALRKWADEEGLEIILTTGGSGVSPRDVTPDATRTVVERTIPGFGERMRGESLKKTPTAIVSRAIAGVRKRSLIIDLPGSPKGAVENLEAVWDAVPHTVAKIRGDDSECAPPPDP